MNQVWQPTPLILVQLGGSEVQGHSHQHGEFKDNLCTQRFVSKKRKVGLGAEEMAQHLRTLISSRRPGSIPRTHMGLLKKLFKDAPSKTDLIKEWETYHVSKALASVEVSGMSEVLRASIKIRTGSLGIQRRKIFKTEEGFTEQILWLRFRPVPVTGCERLMFLL